MKIVLSEDHRLHFPKGELCGGEMVRPFECPERWDYVLGELRSRGFKDTIAPDEIDLELVRKVHDAEFVEFLEQAWTDWHQTGFKGEALPYVIPARRMQQRRPDHIDGRLGYYCMAIDTAITNGTWQAVRSSAACAVTAQRLVADDGHAFALCRPPGHHAARDLYGGYCFLNNAAIAVQAFVEQGAHRVALLDVDFHHGNGSQDIFNQRDDVLFVSLHGRPEDAFPHFSGYADEVGEGAGEGYNINFPLRPGTTGSEWIAALADALKRITDYRPDALVVSLGVDTFCKDPISFFRLESEDFRRYGAHIGRLRLPTLFVMEGGYAVEEIGINTVNVLDGYLDS
ncbi:MAG: acetylpolyamine amidohydrolase [marine bacterium B5-7]|nr:MAG: acetylpolyamine amidohydrolase [marine bacterium B5-7]